MAYEYFLSGSPIIFYSNQERWINDFQTKLNEDFYNAPNVHTIQVEQSFGSGSFIPRDVRILTAIEAETGQKLGDDFKILLFKNVSDAGSIGTKYYWDNNYYLSINTEIEKNLAASVTVRRCNNVLRWVNSSGSFLSEHCAIEYKIASPKNQFQSSPLAPDGSIRIFASLNNKTKTIQENQRFLFGNTNNWVAYRVYGAGINNFMNLETENNDSARLVEFIMGRNYVNEDTDNLELGIADYYKIFASGSSLVDDIEILPVPDYILEGNTIEYSCYLYSSGSPTANVFTFEVADDNVPVDNYEFTTLDGNHFSIKNNEMYLYDPLKINCTSGSAGEYFRQVNITLRGVY